jgi:lipopolysaccharide export system permease protein
LYVIREIALPTVLALLTITFILLIGIVYEFINLLLQPGISVWSVLRMLFLLIPSYVTIALPMAILMGSLIGVGRMTLDREVLAIRASGVNLFSIFAPALGVAMLLSLLIMWASGQVIPQWQGKGLSLAAQLQFELIQSLEPGRFHDKLGAGDDSDMVLYFRDRDEKTPDRDMQGVVLKLEEDFELPASSKAAVVSGSAGSTATLGLAGVTSGTTATLRAKAPLVNPANRRASDEFLTGRSNLLTMIFAERGQIRAQVGDLTAGTRQTAAVVLTLLNGTIHRLVPDPTKHDNIVIHFQKMEKRLFTNTNIKKPFKTQTNAELRQSIRDTRAQALADAEKDKDKKKKALKIPARRELVERYALSLAFFIFTLLAIPMAIWIKPSGKSWGILLAIGLMLFYYVFMKVGGSMVEIGHPMGVVVAFLPNLLFTLLGAGLWWHNLRS